MSDFGHHLEFGYFLVPDADDPDGVLEPARLAGRPGYDQDHPYGEAALARSGETPAPKPSVEHSRRTPPRRACDEDPLADFWRAHG